MPKAMVIVESPAKAKTINRILGPDFVVKASMGHVRDLPQRKLGVDVARDFEPEYVTLKGRESIVRELVAAARKAESIYLAPDPDREGEAIAWHLRELLRGGVAPERFHRITYHEITAEAIRRALRHPAPLDENKFRSQQARRILDRLVGYRVSPLLWRRIRGASSAGRVQSVALRLVCEREREIEVFEPREYWLLGLRVAKRVEPRDPFEVRLTRVDGEKAEILSGEAAEAARRDIEGRPLRVASLQSREVSRRPMPPFITSTLQQAGSRFFGFSPARTMRLAQTLYEGVDLGEGPVGLITYMRTDSVRVAGEAREECRALIAETYGPEYVPGAPPSYRSRSGAQEAHEAIRPTDVRLAPEALRSALKPDELKLYRAIRQRFVASEMAPARIAQRLVEVEGSGARTYTFRASASEVVFPGYLKAMEAGEPDAAGTKEPEEDGAVEVERLPPLAEGEALEGLEWLARQKFTQPPARYSEATLVKALEEHGIGRPSTYAQTLSTLVDRHYVEREKRQLKPSALGRTTCEFLVSNLDALFNVRFTADMEERLDRVERGEENWVEMLREFHGRFGQWLDAARGEPADPAEAAALLEAFSAVSDWAPATGTGRAKRDDRAFVESLRGQLDKKDKPLSERQMAALRAMAGRYADQVPALARFRPADGAGSAAPREVTGAVRGKLALLEGVPFRPPRKVGRKVFDDARFWASLAEQAAAGRGLSENQERALDKLLFQYREEIPGFEERGRALGLAAPEPQAPEGPGEAGERREIEGLLGRLAAVTAWRPPVERRGRTWDDREFFESVGRQFREKGRLSPRQLGALRRMARGYESAPGRDAPGG